MSFTFRARYLERGGALIPHVCSYQCRDCRLLSILNGTGEGKEHREKIIKVCILTLYVSLFNSVPLYSNITLTNFEAT